MYVPLPPPEHIRAHLVVGDMDLSVASACNNRAMVATMPHRSGDKVAHSPSVTRQRQGRSSSDFGGVTSLQLRT